MIIGNDINPMTAKEYRICIVILFFGAFVEAYIIGGITAEMSKGQHQIQNTSKLVDFVSYSMEIHVFPDKIRSSVMQFLLHFQDNIECRAEINEFKQVMNPALQFDFIEKYYYKSIR
jgi:hypothetical protein